MGGITRPLVALLLRELFHFGLLQADLNPANYRYGSDTQRVVLLDYGATREFPALLTLKPKLLRAWLADDHKAVRRPAVETGYLTEQTGRDYQAVMLKIFSLVVELL